MVPALPTTGSTMMQAISLGARRERSLHRGEIVVGQREGELRGLGGNACRAGDAERGDAGAGLDQQRVGVAVIAALELDDEVAAGEAAGQADGGHAGLGAGADEAHLLDGREAAADELGEVRLAGMGCAEAGAAASGFADRFDHRREGVAQDHRAPGAEEVDVAVAVGVVEVRALGPHDEWRMAADGAEGADRRVDSAGKVMLGAAFQIERVHEGLEFLGLSLHELSIGERSEPKGVLHGTKRHGLRLVE